MLFLVLDKDLGGNSSAIGYFSLSIADPLLFSGEIISMKERVVVGFFSSWSTNVTFLGVTVTPMFYFL